MSDVERYQRAGEYVLGLMDSAERARAEHDLERDADFRLAVAALTARIRAADQEIAASQLRSSGWNTIARDLASLPQMQGAAPILSPAETAAGARPDAPRLLLPLAVAVAFGVGVAVGFGAAIWWSAEGRGAAPASASTGEP